jgi:Family of unknown function (DUF5647)
MTDYTSGLSAAERAQTSKNLRLASQFIREFLAAPERFDVLPENATIVLLPSDVDPDTELTLANMEVAKQIERQGKKAILWAVGMPERPGPQVLVRFPVFREGQPAASYDRQKDLLTIEFSQTDRPTMVVQHHPYVTVIVDRETHLAVALAIPNFLTVVAPKSLPLFDVLLLPSTERVGITLNELVSLRNNLAHGDDRPAREQMTVPEILTELARLAA